MNRESDAGAANERAPSGEGGYPCRLCGAATVFALRARDRARSRAAHGYVAGRTAASAPLGGRGAGPVETSGGRRDETFDYFSCTDCGALQLGMLPANLARAYGSDYYTAHQRLASGPPGGLFGWRRLRTQLRLALPSGPLARALSGRRYGRFEWFRRTETGLDDPILDVGCGGGRLLFRLQADGFRRLVGIDPYLAPESAQRADLRSGLKLEVAPPERHSGAYHLVMAHHSFEHMAEPRRAFSAMAALVAPGGWLLLRVPLADSWACAHYGADWAQLDAPRHLQIPTRRSIALLAERTGFRVEHVVDDSGPFQITGSEGGAAGRGFAARRKAAELRRSGQGDQAAFYLRRRA